MALGENVAVLTRRKIGEDTMGEPIYEWDYETVENVLVRPLSGSDLQDELRPDGIQLRYSLAFPKTFDGSLAHARIALVDRGMDPSNFNDALRVSGDPDYVNPCPTPWNRLVDVGRVDG